MNPNPTSGETPSKAGEQHSVPLSFRSAGERKAAALKVDQLALCAEPDDKAELSARKSFDAMRGPATRDGFRDAVRRQREMREARERGR